MCAAFPCLAKGSNGGNEPFKSEKKGGGHTAKNDHIGFGCLGGEKNERVTG